MHSIETRNLVILAYNDKKSPTEICKTFDISRPCLYNWIKLYSIRQCNNNNVKYSYSHIISLQIRLTCMIINKNRYYFCVVMELFSRKMLAYELSIQNNSTLTINTFKKAFESRKFPQSLTFHSDQDANYTSEQYVSLLKTLKVEQSFSQRGTPYDNAVIESFFSNM